MTDNKTFDNLWKLAKNLFSYHYLLIIHYTYLTANSGFPGVMSPSYSATGQFLSQRLLLHLNLGATICLGASDLINSSVSISSGISSSSGSCNRIGTAAGLRTKQFKRDISCWKNYNRMSTQYTAVKTVQANISINNSLACSINRFFCWVHIFCLSVIFNNKKIVFCIIIVS